MPVEEAVRGGLVDAELARRSEMLSVTVADGDEVPAEMAVRAAGEAFRMAAGGGTAAGCHAEDVRLVLHAALFHQGNELWSAAGYVQRRTIGNTCPAIEVRQVSNGGMAALDLAWRYLATSPDAGAALITTADRFCLPGFDRWRSDPGTVYADGGTALVVSTRGGFARLLGLAVVSGPDLEGMHRAGPAHGVGVRVTTRPVDLGAHKAAFVAEIGMARTVNRVTEGQREALRTALDLAGTKLTEIDWFVLPHFGRRRLQSNYLRHLDIGLDRTTWSWNRTVGHLGAGDPIASVDHLVRSGAVIPGQRCLLMAVGAGFTWSCAIIEIDRRLHRAG
ncbi:3-oxoacyl-ACP synthase [Actinosynnema sp. ALI-1.44]|nr:3-oxoacyl-ACP synthase [Actinosynnema sp. ALI-1.44]